MLPVDPIYRYRFVSGRAEARDKIKKLFLRLLFRCNCTIYYTICHVQRNIPLMGGSNQSVGMCKSRIFFCLFLHCCNGPS